MATKLPFMETHEVISRNTQKFHRSRLLVKVLLALLALLMIILQYDHITAFFRGL